MRFAHPHTLSSARRSHSATASSTSPTPAGEMVATIMASLAQWERRVISQRTRDALAERKARGVVLGRPRTVSDEAMVVIRSMRDRGSGYRAIAAELTRLDVPTAQGGKWHPATVRKLAQRVA